MMERFFNLQRLRWENSSDPVLSIRQQEEDAHALLASRGGPVNTSSLFIVLMSTPYIADFQQHGRHVSKNERLLALTFASASQQELPYHLPKTDSSCACAGLDGMEVQHIYLSGSVREGTHVRVWSEIGSDIDAMFQLGPAAVLGEPSDRNSAPSPVMTEFRVHTTTNLGYVLLKHPRREGCHHPEELSFGADRAVGLLDVFRARLDSTGDSRREGPAVSTQVSDFLQHSRNTDLVPCLMAACVWPASRFAVRSRRSGQPAPWLVHKLSGIPVFLVPVGFPGSPTQRDEWRVSFSRHEYILMRYMPEPQRACLTLLKTCKAVLGLRGLKSYHLKTALMWLCETRPRSQWTREGTQASVLDIIAYLEDATIRKDLPCYFWPEMNILAIRSAEELSEISRDLCQLKAHLLSCSLAIVTSWLCGDVPHVAERLLFSATLVPQTERTAESLLLDTFLENVLAGRVDVWACLQSLVSSAVSPGALPMPFASCFSLLFRSARRAFQSLPSSPEGGQDLLGVVLGLLKALQERRRPCTPDEEDTWMVRL